MQKKIFQQSFTPAAHKLHPEPLVSVISIHPPYMDYNMQKLDELAKVPKYPQTVFLINSHICELGKIGDATIIIKFMKVLDGMTDIREDTRHLSVYVLEQIMHRDPRAIKGLLQIAEKTQNLKIMEIVVAALSSQTSESVGTSFIKIFANSQYDISMRLLVGDAIKNSIIGQVMQANDPVIKMLLQVVKNKSEDWRIRCNAIDILCTWSSDEVFALFTKIFADCKEDTRIRFIAGYTIKEMLECYRTQKLLKQIQMACKKIIERPIKSNTLIGKIYEIFGLKQESPYIQNMAADVISVIPEVDSSPRFLKSHEFYPIFRN